MNKGKNWKKNIQILKTHSMRFVDEKSVFFAYYKCLKCGMKMRKDFHYETLSVEVGSSYWLVMNNITLDNCDTNFMNEALQ